LTREVGSLLYGSPKQLGRHLKQFRKTQQNKEKKFQKLAKRNMSEKRIRRLLKVEGRDKDPLNHHLQAFANNTNSHSEIEPDENVGEEEEEELYDTKTDIYSLGVVLFELF
jgi:serine/threonine protein kinase